MQVKERRQVIATLVEPVGYPSTAPFHPSESYPELELPLTSDAPNPVYAGVRACFRLAGLDIANHGRPEWNPLGELIAPGETVLLKPNLVKESHPRDPSGWRYVLTHGSVIRAVADYVWKAVGSEGKVILADAPQTDSSFRRIVEVLGLDAIREFYAAHGRDMELIDLRREEWVSVDGVVTERRRLGGDPRGGVAFDLGAHSEFWDHKGAGRYYGADYDSAEVNRHHTGGRHEYLLAGSAIAADVVFNLPKLKTHKKAGITVSLKGRNEDYVETPEGRRIMRFDYVFKLTKRIAEAQVVQEQPGQVAVLVVALDGYGADEEARLRAAIAEWISPSLEVDVRVVDQIPRDLSGKFRAVRSLLPAR
jgi:hypothetical protein